MAGRSLGFLRSKFKAPRYAIKVNGVSLIERSLRGFGNHKFYFICLKDHYKRININSLISIPNSKVLLVDDPPQGQACTALWAHDYVVNDDPLIIISPMQAIDWNPKEFLLFAEKTDVDGAMVVVRPGDYIGDEKFYVKVSSKNSDVRAVNENYKEGWMFDCGIYYFKYGWYFQQWANAMIARDARVGGDYYVAHSMNDGLIHGKSIKAYMARDVAYWTKPDDVRQFAKLFPSWSRP